LERRREENGVRSEKEKGGFPGDDRYFMIIKNLLGSAKRRGETGLIKKSEMGKRKLIS